MKLNFECPHCNAVNTLKENALTRSELEDKIGLVFERTCTNCGATSDYHVNDVYATGGNLIPKLGRYIALGVAALGFFLSDGNKIAIAFSLLTGAVIFMASRRLKSTASIDAFNSIEIDRK
ncbi:MAG: hypothetical protein AAFO07_03255 [Bacteroidota bacterium]